MLTAQAHSFSQQARLAVTLAWVAGYTNIITVVTCATVTSHVSGTASNLGRDIASGEWSLAVFAAFLLLTFFVGAALSGLLTEYGRRRGWESIYILPMSVETVLLAVFALLIEFGGYPIPATSAPMWWMSGVASTAMGIQNATITRISSGVVRTTHMTGILTDLGLESVQFLYGLADRRKSSSASIRGMLVSLHRHQSTRRLALLGGIILLFMLGAGLGTVVYSYVPRFAMFPPVCFLIWIIYQDTTRPIAEIEAAAILGAADFALPPAIAVFHLCKDKDRRGKVQRLPNLLLWSERLSPEIQVVILDLDGTVRLDENAAFEIRALLTRFHRENRHLIISGIGAEQYRLLRNTGSGDMLDPSNACSDLELAIARGMNLIADRGADRRGDA